MKKNESQNMLYKRDNESEKINYIKELYGEEDASLKAVTQSIVDNNIRPINIGADEGRLVQILLKLHKAKTVIEVGTLAGYSTIWIARALQAGGKVYSFENDEKVAKIARDNISKSDVANRVEIIVGDAHEKLKDIRNKGPFDAMFIDAEKGGYCKYLDWAEKNIKSDGLILADNTFMFGLAYDDGLPSGKYTKEVPVMKEFNRRIADKSKYEGIIIPTVEGLTVAIKKF
jgi:predicted O-methyltransferase YrrM